MARQRLLVYYDFVHIRHIPGTSRNLPFHNVPMGLLLARTLITDHGLNIEGGINNE
jgi:hypothetical protein